MLPSQERGLKACPAPPRLPPRLPSGCCGPRECEAVLRAVTPGRRERGRSELSPNACQPSQPPWDQPATTCGVVVTGLFGKKLQGQSSGGHKDAGSFRCRPSPPSSSAPHPTSCPACCSVLTHGHASWRPRKRPCFGAEPAQNP